MIITMAILSGISVITFLLIYNVHFKVAKKPYRQQAIPNVNSGVNTVANTLQRGAGLLV